MSDDPDDGLKVVDLMRWANHQYNGVSGTPEPHEFPGSSENEVGTIRPYENLLLGEDVDVLVRAARDAARAALVQAVIIDLAGWRLTSACTLVDGLLDRARFAHPDNSQIGREIMDIIGRLIRLTERETFQPLRTSLDEVVSTVRVIYPLLKGPG